MITIAVYNLKGGVGKTATAVNLSYLAAEQGERTLLWDLDPQASTTFYYQMENDSKVGLRNLFAKTAGLSKLIQESGYENLDIIPADLSIRNTDIFLDEMKSSKRVLSGALEHLKHDYDYVFIDCPPGFSLLSENIFQAADYILMPMIPTTLSVRTHDILIEYFNQNNIDVDKIIPFFSMFDSRKNLHHEIYLDYTKQKVALKTAIPYASEIERMGVSQSPLVSYSRASQGAIAYQDLWKELKRKMR